MPAVRNKNNKAVTITEDWKQKAERLRFKDGLSWTELAQAMLPDFSELTLSQVREKVRDHIRSTERYTNSGPRLVFSDMHTPFDLPNFPYFLRDMAQKYKCKSAICLGDGFDCHAISKHDPEPCAFGAYTETDMAIQRLKIYYVVLPDVEYVPGNHDYRIERAAAREGIGRRFLKDLHEILEMPEGWTVREDDVVIDSVLYVHGENCCGKNGALNKAITERMSVCIGHSHAFGGVQYQANSRDKIFGMNVGCGVNEKAYAFAYGKHSHNRCTPGCGIVFDSQHAIFEPMGQEYMTHASVEI